MEIIHKESPNRQVIHYNDLQLLVVKSDIHKARIGSKAWPGEYFGNSQLGGYWPPGMKAEL